MANSQELKYHPEARVDVLEAVRWYLAKSSAAAIDFQQQLRLAEQQVQNTPHAWSPYLHECRIYRLKRFPYGIVFQVRQDYILIVAVAHLRRKPGFWKDRSN